MLILGFGPLLNAIRRLAAALNGLAETVEQTNVSVRSRLALDADDDLDVSQVRRLPQPGEPEVDGGEQNGESAPATGGKKGKKS